MRIIVLGGTGYLGSKVVMALAERGHEILCIKREQSSLKRLEAVRGQIYFADISDLGRSLDRKEPYDCLVNTACKYPRNAKDDFDIFEANFCVPLKILLECLPHGIKKFVTVGTGLPDEFNAYSFAKNEFARVCRWYGQQKSIGNLSQVCNIELENFYGADEPKDRFITATVEKLKNNEKILLTEGNQKRDFVYIDDVIRAITVIVEKEDLPEYMDLPLGTGEGVPVREVIEYLKCITNSKSELCFGAIPKRTNEPDSIADCTKMQECGIDIQYNWQEGLKKLV